MKHADIEDEILELFKETYPDKGFKRVIITSKKYHYKRDDESNNFIKHNSNGINKTKANGIANSGIAKSAKIMSLGINLRLLL